MQNYYRLLGVPETASPLEIEQAYLRLSARLRRAAADPVMRGRLQEAQTGYEILLDPGRRWAYDQLLLTEPVDPAPPRRRDQARELLLSYAPTARWLNRALLAFALLIGLDWALPAHKYVNEWVLNRVPVSVSASASDPQMAYDFTTPHTKFRLHSSVAHRVRVEQLVTVWSTPLLRIVRQVSSATSPDGPAPFAPHGGTIYRAFALVPVLIFLTALIGVLPNRSPETLVNTAGVGLLLAVLALVVIVWF